MFLLVGLGNPGIKYALTRHNVGFWVIDELARRAKVNINNTKHNACFVRSALAGKEVILLKPLTYMNRSGLAVSAFMKDLAIEVDKLLVVYDDMDLPLGRIRLRPRGGSGGHRGMDSIITMVGTGDFSRLRLGVGRGTGKLEDDVDFLLSPFVPEEEETMRETVLRAADAVELFLSKGLEEAMNRYNTPLKRAYDL